MNLSTIAGSCDIPLVAKVCDIDVTVSSKADDNSAVHPEASFMPGQQVTLHKIYSVKKLRALGEKENEEYLIPVNSTAVVERLPKDERLDYRSYDNVTEILSSNPMPSILRSTTSWNGDKNQPSSIVVEDDIISITGIDMDFGERYLIATNQNGDVLRLPETTCTAEFTTMLDKEPIPLSQICENDLPQRVCLQCVDESKGPTTKILHIVDCVVKDHVLVTCPGEETIYSIPCDYKALKLTPLNTEDISIQELLGSLKPLYTSLNTTYNVTEMNAKAPAFCIDTLPQPLKPIEDQWMKSLHANSLMNKIKKIRKEEKQEKVEILQRQIGRLNHMLKAKFGSSIKTNEMLKRRIPRTISCPPLDQSITSLPRHSGSYGSIKECLSVENCKPTDFPQTDEMEPVDYDNESDDESEHSDFTDDKLLHLQKLSVEDVSNLLRQLNLSEYEMAFKKEGVDGELLVALTQEILVEDFKMTKFHAVKLLTKMDKINLG